LFDILFSSYTPPFITMSSVDSKPDLNDLKGDDVKVQFDTEKVEIPALDAHYDPVFVRKTMYAFIPAPLFPPSHGNIHHRRMIDWRMLPLLGFVYAVALIDRTNLGIARTSGMDADLVCSILPVSSSKAKRVSRNSASAIGIVSHPWSTSSRIFSCKSFLLLTVCTLHIFLQSYDRQIPGNIILRWIGARLWLTICVVGWGFAQLGMAFVPTWGYLSLCRVLLGVFEVSRFMGLYAVCWATSLGSVRLILAMLTRHPFRLASSPPWPLSLQHGTSATRFKSVWLYFTLAL